MWQVDCFPSSLPEELRPQDVPYSWDDLLLDNYEHAATESGAIL